MNGEVLTIDTVKKFLMKELKKMYPERELNTIISIILTHLTGRDRSFLLANPDHPVSSHTWLKVSKICTDLKNRKPVQYITGETEFYGLPIIVGPGTLIPRPETEELVELVINEHRYEKVNILDIGTGTGCIAVSLSKHMPQADIAAMDISEESLELASKNASLNDVSISLFIDNISVPVESKYGEYDIVISNPPYITESEKINIDSNILDYEPHHALFVPDDMPLVYYESILKLCRSILRPGGSVYFEINEAGGKEMVKLLYEYGYNKISLLQDINKKDRFIAGKKI